jgi:predicted nucleic acid-binding protein
VTTVVSDTSPINYLCLIGEIEVLPRLFEEILIPPAVWAELRHPRAPKAVATWLANLPAWAKIQAPAFVQPNLGIDPGEAEAISLALEMGLPAILIDEKTGREVAEERGLVALGTLNILNAADLRGFVDCMSAIERLRQTNFHITDAMVDALLREVRARKAK